MFSGCKNFNQPLNSWNVSNVINMSEMFYNCKNFNQLLDKWDIRNVKHLRDIFKYTKVDLNFVRSWIPVKVDISELKETFGKNNLPLEWQVLKGLRSLTDLTKEEYKSLHPNCKNYLKQTIIDF
ncbi:MAG: BspA family leucine-rich repeat surface protein, partial [Nanopusillaceae archaeon]